MILFFSKQNLTIYAVQSLHNLSKTDIQKLNWLFGDTSLNEKSLLTAGIDRYFIGPRSTMITPWSTNAVEITQNMAIEGIVRIEEFHIVLKTQADFDPMLLQKYDTLDQDVFTINIQPEPILEITDIAAYNKKEGLSLNQEEVTYLQELSKKLERPLTDSEVFGFSQVNSEHCRHKIFNGTFIIDMKEKPSSLFKLIKKTATENPNTIISAYKDNVAFIDGPTIEQFAPKSADKPDFYEKKNYHSVISLKAETHNFPTTVEPFNGAATGSGGEIRDRLAGGKGSLPLAGTAVYMTSYSRLEKNRPWEQNFKARKWLYQTPLDLLIKASNGASDFGNKFGQPLIAGSVLTFEHKESLSNSPKEPEAEPRLLGYDKVIMMAGGIGYGKKDQSIKDKPKAGDNIVILGGDNYRIGMGGAAVSSADTGAFSSGIELNAIQRSNPEMQKRAANAIRAMVERDVNLIVSIHDHGAGGHLNCLSELIEETGGKINLDALPVGDPTLSAKEIIGNESQERMGLVIGKENTATLRRIAERERAPMYEVGTVTSDNRFVFVSKAGKSPMDLALADMFGSSPKTIMKGITVRRNYPTLHYDAKKIKYYLTQVLQLEAVACKDWLTNKVDRCVTGRVAKQQCVGPLQIPLNNCGVMALDYNGKEGVATSIGHSPISGLIDPIAGSRNSIAEALTNIVWAPLKDGLQSVSLSANWMWPCNNEGEDARLYEAVEAVSQFAIALGINVPTGKDSLSMKQKYPDGDVISPGTVIISAAGNCDAITQVVEPLLQKGKGSIYYINLSKDGFKLGGSSFAQILNEIGNEAPSVNDASYFKNTFNTIQDLIRNNHIAAGHDISSGGLLTALLEMCFADTNLGADIILPNHSKGGAFETDDLIKILFAENSGLLIQANEDAAIENTFAKANIEAYKIGTVTESDSINITHGSTSEIFSISEMRDIWYKTSHLLDRKQSSISKADERYENYKNQPLNYTFPTKFNGNLPEINTTKPRIKAAILREKGSNSEREMANAMYLAGFDVKDVHMTDLISGRETLEGIQFIAAVGGFSNSDVLGSAKGWAGAFLYNEKANKALKDFYARPDTLSLGVCNGCQLFIELGLINPDHDEKPKMLHNDSGKFECNFTSVEIAENRSVMLSTLAGSKLGIWAAHGEGKFSFPYGKEKYNIVGTYGYEGYPANPNGSDFNTAMLTSDDGRHLVMMPHLERSTFPWNWAHYPKDRNDEVSPWVEAFLNAREWLEKK